MDLLHYECWLQGVDVKPGEIEAMVILCEVAEINPYIKSLMVEAQRS